MGAEVIRVGIVAVLGDGDGHGESLHVERAGVLKSKRGYGTVGLTHGGDGGIDVDHRRHEGAGDGAGYGVLQYVRAGNIETDGEGLVHLVLGIRRYGESEGDARRPYGDFNHCRRGQGAAEVIQRGGVAGFNAHAIFKPLDKVKRLTGGDGEYDI